MGEPLSEADQQIQIWKARRVSHRRAPSSRRRPRRPPLPLLTALRPVPLSPPGS
jgi:hypothetical protein